MELTLELAKSANESTKFLSSLLEAYKLALLKKIKYLFMHCKYEIRLKITSIPCNVKANGTCNASDILIDTT